MSDFLGWILGGIGGAIVGGTIASVVLKGRYESAINFLKSQKAEIKQKPNNSEEKIGQLQSELKEVKENFSSLEKQYNDSISQNTFYQNQIISLREEFSVNNKNEAVEIHNAFNKIQSLQERERYLIEEGKNYKSKINDAETKLISANLEIENIKKLLEQLSLSKKEQEGFSIELEDAKKRVNELIDNESKLSNDIMIKDGLISEASEKLNQLNVEINLLKQQLEKANQLRSIPEVLQKQKSILMVDDSAVIRAKMKKLLIEAGYDLTLAIDGLDALKVMEGKHFDLIITDLEMPNLDGFGFLNKLGQTMETKHIPVIIITGHEDVNIKVGESESLSGIYKKPWNEPELLRKVKFLSSLEQ
jgi:CheY-like chemotaxis protein